MNPERASDNQGNQAKRAV